MELTKTVKSDALNSNNFYCKAQVLQYLCRKIIEGTCIKKTTSLIKIPKLNTKTTIPFDSVMNINNYLHSVSPKSCRKPLPFGSKVYAYPVYLVFDMNKYFNWTSFWFSPKTGMLNIDTDRIFEGFKPS